MINVLLLDHTEKVETEDTATDVTYVKHLLDIITFSILKNATHTLTNDEVQR